LGAKLGGRPSAAAEKLPARYTAPARAPRVKFPACLAIGSSSATLLGAGRQELGLARWYEQLVVAIGLATAYRSGGTPPPASALGAALTLPTCVRWGSVTAMTCPPLAPPRSGWTQTLTSMPGVRVFGRQPCRAKPAGPPISIAHCSALPSVLFTISRIQLWGLVHWNSLT